MRMQDGQKRDALHAPAQSPLRSDYLSEHLRAPVVRVEERGLALFPQLEVES